MPQLLRASGSTGAARRSRACARAPRRSCRPASAPRPCASPGSRMARGRARRRRSRRRPWDARIVVSARCGPRSCASTAASPSSATSPSPRRRGAGVVEVLAAGLNPVDVRSPPATSLRRHEPPYVVGSEGVGRRRTARTSTSTQAVAPYGSFAERALITPRSGYAFPAASIPRSRSPRDRRPRRLAGAQVARRAQPGETVLILGASGLVGQIAVQAARLLGAGHVVAAARSEEGLRARRRARRGRRPSRSPATTTGRRAPRGRRRRRRPRVRPAVGRARDRRARRAEAVRPAGPARPVGGRRGDADLRGDPRHAARDHRPHELRAPAGARRAAYERMAAPRRRRRATAEVERVPLEDVPDAWERQASAPGASSVIEP